MVRETIRDHGDKKETHTKTYLKNRGYSFGYLFFVYPIPVTVN